MSKRRNSFFMAAASIALAAGTIASAAPAYAASDIGGLNITAFCKANFGSAWSATTNNPSSPYSWYCVKPGSSIAIGGTPGMNDVCYSNYGAGAYAVLTYYSAYGWRCYR